MVEEIEQVMSNIEGVTDTLQEAKLVIPCAKIRAAFAELRGDHDRTMKELELSQTANKEKLSRIGELMSELEHVSANKAALQNHWAKVKFMLNQAGVSGSIIDSMDELAKCD